jgi:hypothetical protein
LIDAISFTSAAFEFRRSPGNQLLSSTKCAIQFRPKHFEHSAKDANVDTSIAQQVLLTNQEEDGGWKTLVYDNDYKIEDKSIPLAYITAKNDINNNTRYQTDMEFTKTISSSAYHVLDDVVTPELRNDLQHSSVLFKKTIQEVFKCTRLVCFS